MLAFFGGKAPAAPPEPELHFAAPSASPYVLGLALVVVSQIVTVPLCVLAHKFRRTPAVLVAIGAVTVVAGLYLPPIVVDLAVERGMGTEIDCLLGRFCGATVYAFVALRMFGAAVGATPKGADADVAIWITFATGAVDITFDKDGKPLKPPPGAIADRLKFFLLRLAGLSLVSSLSEPYDGYPFHAALGGPAWGTPLGALAGYLDHVWIQLMLIWLFLSMTVDVGCLMLEAQGFAPIAVFDNPVFTSTSARIFWGKKWNLQVTTSFKRCVFVPLAKLQLPNAVAAFLTFFASGLFHEYQFVLSFPTYPLGRISQFFVLHGLLCAADAMFSKAVGKKYLANVPFALKAFSIPLLYSPTVPMFAQCWIQAGFFTLISKMGVFVSYK